MGGRICFQTRIEKKSITYFTSENQKQKAKDIDQKKKS